MMSANATSQLEAAGWPVWHYTSLVKSSLVTLVMSYFRYEDGPFTD